MVTVLWWFTHSWPSVAIPDHHSRRNALYLFPWGSKTGFSKNNLYHPQFHTSLGSPDPCVVTTMYGNPSLGIFSILIWVCSLFPYCNKSSGSSLNSTTMCPAHTEINAARDHAIEHNVKVWVHQAHCSVDGGDRLTAVTGIGTNTRLGDHRRGQQLPELHSWWQLYLRFHTIPFV